LFSTASSQSSLRNVQSYGMSKPGNLYNQWAYCGSKDIEASANACGDQALYQDARGCESRYVHSILQALTLSNDASEVLSLARRLTLASVPFRKQADPKFHLNAWDAGWYQVKNGVLKAHMPKEFEEFNQLFNKFAKRLAEGVYKFEFLLD